MRKSILAGFLALFMLAMSGNFAKAQTTNDEPATTLWVDEIIAASGRPKLFENISRGSDAALRHLGSGLECHFGEERESLHIFKNAAVRAGEDVGCSIWYGPILTSFAVTRYRPTPTLDQAVASSWPSPEETYPGAKLFDFAGPRPPEIRPRFQMPEIRVRRLTYEQQGMTLFTREAVSIVKDWVVEQRITTPIENAGDAETYAQMQMLAGVAGMAGSRHGTP